MLSHQAPQSGSWCQLIRNAASSPRRGESIGDVDVSIAPRQVPIRSRSIMAALRPRTRPDSRSQSTITHFVSLGVAYSRAKVQNRFLRRENESLRQENASQAEELESVKGRNKRMIIELEEQRALTRDQEMKAVSEIRNREVYKSLFYEKKAENETLRVKLERRHEENEPGKYLDDALGDASTTSNSASSASGRHVNNT